MSPWIDLQLPIPQQAETASPKNLQPALCPAFHQPKKMNFANFASHLFWSFFSTKWSRFTCNYSRLISEEPWLVLSPFFQTFDTCHFTPMLSNRFVNHLGRCLKIGSVSKFNQGDPFIRLMEEILHQLIGSFSHYLGAFTSQVVQDFLHQQYSICFLFPLTQFPRKIFWKGFDPKKKLKEHTFEGHKHLHSSSPFVNVTPGFRT